MFNISKEKARYYGLKIIPHFHHKQKGGVNLTTLLFKLNMQNWLIVAYADCSNSISVVDTNSTEDEIAIVMPTLSVTEDITTIQKQVTTISSPTTIPHNLQVY